MFQEIADILGGGLFKSIAEVLKTVVTDPTKKLEAEQALLALQIDTTRKLAELEVQDRSNARDREIKTGDKTTRNLAYMSVFGFFGLLAAQIYMAFNHIQIMTEIQRTLDITTGILFAMVLAVKDYYFGTSSSSAEKTIQIGQALKNESKK